jgi:hypothetical protein
MAKLTLSVSEKMAKAVEANPNNLRLTAKGADGISVVERCDGQVSWANEPDLLDLFCQFQGPKELYDQITLALVRTGKLRIFVIGQCLAPVPAQGVEAFLLARPTATEVSEEQFQEYLKVCDDPFEPGHGYDPLGVWSGKLDMSVVKWDEIVLLYGSGKGMSDAIVNRLRTSEIKCFSVKPDGVYFVARERIAAFLTDNPGAVEISLSTIKRQWGYAPEPAKDEMLAAAASKALRNVKSKR